MANFKAAAHIREAKQNTSWVRSSKPADDFMKNLYVAIADLHNKHRSEAAKESMYRRVKNGYSISPPLLGYKKGLQSGVYEPDEPNFKRLKKSFISFKNGKDIKDCLSQLNKGYPNKKLNIKKYRSILSHPYYAGFTTYKDEAFPGKHIAMITAQEYRDIKTRLKDQSI